VPKTGFALQVTKDNFHSLRYSILLSARRLGSERCFSARSNPGPIIKCTLFKGPGIFLLVPKTGFEPACPYGRYHLKVVRLPISPPGQVSSLSLRWRHYARKSALFQAIRISDIFLLHLGDLDQLGLNLW
jgi:hypothetical protein